MAFVDNSQPQQQGVQVAPGNSLHTVRGPVGSFHLWVFVSFIIVIVAIALMVPQLRGQLFGAAVALYNMVAPAPTP